MGGTSSPWPGPREPRPPGRAGDTGGLGYLAAGADVNLDTHIDQVTQLAAETSEPTVLVGHSYAGSVLTGVADRLPERIAALLYVDAFVPRDGESCWSMTNDEQRKWYAESSGRTGLAR